MRKFEMIIKNNMLLIVLLLTIFLPSQLLAKTGSRDLVTNVTVTPTELDMEIGGMIDISWQLREAGRVSAFICDIHGNVVKTFLQDEEHVKGAGSLAWDGLDDQGDACINGLYFPVIKLKTRRKGIFIYNSSSLPWGEDVSPLHLDFDPDQETISFSVDRMTFGRLRVGLRDGGPVYKTISGWRLYPPGNYQVPWDGMDSSGLERVTDNEKFHVVFDSFSLPEYGIMLTGGDDGYNRGELDSYNKFPIHQANGGQGGQVSYFALVADSLVKEPEITVRWQGDVNKGKEKKTILRGKATCTVDFVDLDDSTSILKGASELLIYLDNAFISEVPVKELPAKISLDSKQFSNGPHIVTINLLTSDDRAGVKTMKVHIAN